MGDWLAIGLTAVLLVLSKPVFWFCVIALVCTATIRRGLREVAHQIFSFRVALRLPADRDDDDPDDPDSDDDSDLDLPVGGFAPIDRLMEEARVRQKLKR